MLREEKNKSEATKKFQNRQCWKESTNILSTKQRYRIVEEHSKNAKFYLSFFR